MDAENEAEPQIRTLPRGPNPYIGRDRCLVCRCERPTLSGEEGCKGKGE